MRDTEIGTTEQFIEWANNQSPNRRFILRDVSTWTEDGEKTRYVLDIAGTGSTFHTMSSIRIPLEIGQALEPIWKRNDYRRFIGQRGIKSILKIIGGSDAVKDWANTRYEVEAKNNHQTQINITEYAIEKLTESLRALETANKIMSDDLGMQPTIAASYINLKRDALGLRLQTLLEEQAERGW